MAKNMTSKFPLYIILLEIVEQLKARNLLLDLQWQSREFNKAADDLSNGIFDAFNLDLRIKPDLAKMDWIIMPRLYREAELLHAEICSKKLDRAHLKNSWKGLESNARTKKRKHAGLKVTDPW